MATPVVVYGDAQAAAAAFLREQFATRTAPYLDGVMVGTRVPLDRSIDTPHAPYVMVAQDAGGEMRTIALSVVDLRVTVWATTEDDAFDLAQLAHGLLLTHSGDVIRSTVPALSPFPTLDPETGESVASFNVTANLRPRAV